jgi:hypothetical protein
MNHGRPRIGGGRESSAARDSWLVNAGRGVLTLGARPLSCVNVFLCSSGCITLGQHQNRVEEAENPAPQMGA